MKQFFTILKFEYTEYLKNKVFRIVTVIGVILIALLLSLPSITGMFSSDKDSSTQQTEETQTIVIADKTGRYSDPQLYSGAFGGQYTFAFEDKTEQQLTDRINNGEIRAAVLIESPDSFKLLQEQDSMFSGFTSQLEAFFNSAYKVTQLSELGVTPQDSAQVMSHQVEFNVVETGKSFGSSYFLAYVLIFLLYMSIMMYGQLVATAVAGEKSSRAMEMLITHAKPLNLMFGKVIGSCLAGLTQIAVLIGASYLFYSLNKGSYGQFDVINTIFGQSAGPILYMVIFYILGFFIYGFLFGAIGSLASRVEDINTTSMPVILLLIVSFLLGFLTMADPNSTLSVVCSFIPFISPTVMFGRICMTDVSMVQILLSILINTLAIGAVGWLSAKIYRLGVLLYGTPPKLSAVFQMLRTKS